MHTIWQPILHGNICAKEIFCSSSGVWIVCQKSAFFVLPEARYKAPFAYKSDAGEHVLGVVDNVLFLYDPSDKEIRVCRSDGSVQEIAIDANDYPSAVSRYLHKTPALNVTRIKHIPEEVWVYSAPSYQELRVGKSFVAMWERYEKYLWVYGRKENGYQRRTMMVLGDAGIEDVRVGETVVMVSGVFGSLVFEPWGVNNQVFKQKWNLCALDEDTNRIAVHDRTRKAVFCWEWGSTKYGSLEIGHGEVTGLFVSNGMVFVQGTIDGPGIFAAPFPEPTLEGCFWQRDDVV